MKIISRVLDHFRKMSSLAAQRGLFFLLLIDFLFIAIHFLHYALPILESEKFKITHDGGYAELFQYGKLILILILLARAINVTGCRSYLVWIGMFLYFLVDDALSLHEWFGAVAGNAIERERFIGFHIDDLGELFFVSTIGGILLAVLVVQYRRGESNFRKTSIDLTILVAILAFFGGLVDLIHAALQNFRLIAAALGVIEDGGEMVIVSMIVWYLMRFCPAPAAARSIYLHEVFRCGCLRKPT